MTLTFNANNLQPSDRSLFLEIAQGLHDTPSVRGVDTIVPDAAYRVHRNRIYDSLGIVLIGWVAGIGANDAAKASNYTATMKLLRTWFDPTGTAANLVVGLNDATTGTISCKARDFIPGPLVYGAYRRISVGLEAYANWAFA